MRRTSMLQRLMAIAVAVAATFALTGCGVQHWPARLEELGPSRVPSESDAIDVALAVDDRNRVDSWDDLYDPIHRSAVTGPAWLKVFRGDPATRPILTLKSTAILVDSIGEGVGARRITYVAEGTLSFGGRDYLIHAQGRAVTTQTISRAVPSAVGKCVVDAGHRVAAIVNPTAGAVSRGAVPPAAATEN